MAELVDAHGSGPCAARCGGSSPLLGTIEYSESRIVTYYKVGAVFLYAKNYAERISQGRIPKMLRILTQSNTLKIVIYLNLQVLPLC